MHFNYLNLKQTKKNFLLRRLLKHGAPESMREQIPALNTIKLLLNF